MSGTPIYDNLRYPNEPDPKPKKNDTTPRPKVVAATVGAGVGSALATVLSWAVEASAHIDIPAEVELAFGVVLTAGLAFIGGYFKRG